MELIIQKGKELSKSLIRMWNKTMKNVFSEDNPLKVKNRSNFSEHIFLFIKDKGKIVSMGRLIQVKINFSNKDYNILGIADVVSISRRKGYGKILIKNAIKYIKNHRKTGLGFIEKKNVNFYATSEFKIKKEVVKRFYYKNNKGELIGGEKGHNNLIYINGPDNFIKKILSTKSKVLIPIPHW